MGFMDKLKGAMNAVTGNADVQPSFTGEFVTHEFQVRGRIEATGNDPDSGFTNIKIGLKS